VDPEYTEHEERSNAILALTGSGRLATVPQWTQCGDVVAGLVLPSPTRSNTPFLILRPKKAKELDLEALLIEKIRQRIRPILHCRLLGQSWMDKTGLKFDDQSTPEYERDMAERESLLCDTLWKKIIPGCAAKDFRTWPDPKLFSEEIQHGSTIAWRTFAIHQPLLPR
jgi:hypothetical protein